MEGNPSVCRMSNVAPQDEGAYAEYGPSSPRHAQQPREGHSAPNSTLVCDCADGFVGMAYCRRIEDFVFTQQYASSRASTFFLDTAGGRRASLGDTPLVLDVGYARWPLAPSEVYVSFAEPPLASVQQRLQLQQSRSPGGGGRPVAAGAVAAAAAAAGVRVSRVCPCNETATSAARLVKQKSAPATPHPPVIATPPWGSLNPSLQRPDSPSRGNWEAPFLQIPAQACPPALCAEA